MALVDYEPFPPACRAVRLGKVLGREEWGWSDAPDADERTGGRCTSTLFAFIAADICTQ